MSNPNRFVIYKDTSFGRGMHGQYKTRGAATRALVDDKARGFIGDHQRPSIERNPHYNPVRRGASPGTRTPEGYENRPLRGQLTRPQVQLIRRGGERTYNRDENGRFA